MKALPWFRMYTDFLDDPKMIALAFEDQRHFIGVLALKSAGVLEVDCSPKLIDRIVAQRLWIDYAVIEDVKKRLVNGELIDNWWQPLAWDKRQMPSDFDATGAERQRKYRNALRNASHNGTVTPPEEIREEEIREEKKKGIPTPGGVSDSVFQDFKKLRTAKKSPLTQTALDGITREAAKAGLPLATVLEMCCERGWVGFKAEWAQEKRPAYLPPQPSDTVPSKQGIDPTLAKLNAEAEFVKPPSAEMRQKLEALRRGVLQ